MFYYKEKIEFDEKAARKFLKPNILDPLTLLKKGLESLDEFSEKKLEDVFKAVMDETGLKLGKIAQPVRVALTGGTASPGIFEIISVLGKEAVLSRLAQALDYINSLPPADT